jgi:predicted TIM-barrel fold metal-dependent hydrolase
VNALIAAAEWLWSGVPLRFPGLSVAMSEGGIGWVPMLMDRVDYVLEPLGLGDREHLAWPSELRPSEVLRRNFWFCTIDDPSVIALRHRIGVDHIMVESDYPHADSTWPDTQAVLTEDTSGTSPPTSCARSPGERGRAVPPSPPGPTTGGPRAGGHGDPDPACRVIAAGTRRGRRRARGRARGGLDDVPERYRTPDHARRGHGYEHVVVGDTEILAVPLGTLATSRLDASRTLRRSARWRRPGPGGSDPVARLADMDTEGIDQAVLYPSIGLYFWALDRPRGRRGHRPGLQRLAGLVLRRGPGRLFGAAMLPVQDPAAAAAELRRAARRARLPAAFVRPNPCLGRSLSDRAYEPMWDAAEEVGMPIGIHEGSSVIVPTLGSDRPFNPLVLHAVSHSFEEMLACAQLIAFGVLERHPDLRVVFLESSGGWVPFWLERLDEQAESFGGFCPEMRWPRASTSPGSAGSATRSTSGTLPPSPLHR